ncbi:TMAO reductase system periplasmic protein TorT [Aliiroseovarius sp. F20344]|uniref:TMAO reductase system periplasmic protein TorT n=1 Tax=Aliiroseovarius sp. F20344 TaxID=2926414 RepID=UPI001FF61091|nr:TMAO reductase system periplasmic protein TorT [Aliiroseovarius sp. F20344]MCK0143632.1 TMAO reductase system periplasmic protein TorT [Aliiroseovarius sp. F20344]
MPTMTARKPMSEKTSINFLSKDWRRIARPYARPIATAIIGLSFAVGLSAEDVKAQTNEAELSICVLVPHFKDEYWLSVGYGLEHEAQGHSLDLMFFEAGGYQSRDSQISQLNECAARQVDAILIGAVSSDHPDMLATIRDVSQKLPVFGLVNELHSEDLSGRIGVDWQQMGQVLGDYLALRHPFGSPPKRAVLISGPVESGWAPPLELGLRSGLSDSSIEIVGVFSADTGLRQQLKAVEDAFATIPDIDLLIGSAPAVESTVGLSRVTDMNADVDLVSTYISHTIMRSILNGRVLAVPFDDPVQQGELALNQVLRSLQTGRKGGLEGPTIRLFTHDEKSKMDIPLSPSGYFPEIQ